jgi:hypothetical protein
MEYLSIGEFMNYQPKSKVKNRIPALTHIFTPLLPLAYCPLPDQ